MDDITKPTSTPQALSPTPSPSPVAASFPSEVPTPPVGSPVPPVSSEAPASTLSSPPVTTPPPMKKKKPILMMLAVLIVVAALAAVAVYGYSKAKPKKAVVAPTAATTMVAKVAPATTSNVDQATKDIDAALAKADTQKDVSSADLTDTTLGL